MIVKRNGDKVILKDGKVSCSCCEGPGECCMYPAQALIDGLYTADDLPDEVLLFNANWSPPEGTILTKNGSIYEGDDGFGNPISISARSPEPSLPIDWILDTPDGWEYVNVNNPNCLFEPDIYDGVGQGARDQFADTYTATDPQGNPPITLTRESLCVWRGPEPDLYTLRYLDDSASEGFKCKWAFIDSIKDEGQFQNTPTGNYTQPEQENPWVIS